MTERFFRRDDSDSPPPKFDFSREEMDRILGVIGKGEVEGIDPPTATAEEMMEFVCRIPIEEGAEVADRVTAILEILSLTDQAKGGAPSVDSMGSFIPLQDAPVNPYFALASREIRILLDPLDPEAMKDATVRIDRDSSVLRIEPSVRTQVNTVRRKVQSESGVLSMRKANLLLESLDARSSGLLQFLVDLYGDVIEAVDNGKVFRRKDDAVDLNGIATQLNACLLVAQQNFDAFMEIKHYEPVGPKTRELLQLLNTFNKWSFRTMVQNLDNLLTANTNDKQRFEMLVEEFCESIVQIGTQIYLKVAGKTQESFVDVEEALFPNQVAKARSSGALLSDLEQCSQEVEFLKGKEEEKGKKFHSLVASWQSGSDSDRDELRFIEDQVESFTALLKRNAVSFRIDEFDILSQLVDEADRLFVELDTLHHQLYSFEHHHFPGLERNQDPVSLIEHDLVHPIFQQISDIIGEEKLKEVVRTWSCDMIQGFIRQAYYQKMLILIEKLVPLICTDGFEGIEGISFQKRQSIEAMLTLIANGVRHRRCLQVRENVKRALQEVLEMAS